MGTPPAEYDDRYLRGVELFNAGEYFDAHEVWEDLWHDCPAADRRFYQSLIQAAVALYHWGNGNRPGAARLFHSGRRYMEPYRPAHRGLDVDSFWQAVEAALGSPLPSGERSARLREPGEGRPGADPPEARDRPPLTPNPSPPRGEGGTAPQIVLAPCPARWPDPREARHD